MDAKDVGDESRNDNSGTEATGARGQRRATEAAAAHRDPGQRRAPRPRYRRVLRVVGIAVLALAMVTGLSAAYLYRRLNDNLTVLNINKDILIKQPHRAIPVGPNGPQNILIMGSDSRCGAGNNIDGHGCAGGQRSDTTILIHLSGDHQRAYGISIPRDTLVDRPPCKTTDGGVSPASTRQMWNAAFSIGGAACTVAQFMEVTGIPVDHWVQVDFESFQTMVGALGGVPICLPEAIDDPNAQLDLPAGNHVLTGQEALGYVREREALGDHSDLSRTRRQQAFIGAMINKVMSAGTLSNPVKLIKFADAATKGLGVDEGLGNLHKLAGLAYDFRNIGLNHIQFLTAPVYDDPTEPGRVDLSADAPRLWDALLHDRPLDKSLTSTAISANDVPGGKNAPAAGSPTPGASTSATDGTEHPEDSQTKAAMKYAGLCTTS